VKSTSKYSKRETQFVLFNPINFISPGTECSPHDIWKTCWLWLDINGKGEELREIPPEMRPQGLSRVCVRATDVTECGRVFFLCA
jgi:hypothetical protein